jgi:hypothetical protein
MSDVESRPEQVTEHDARLNASVLTGRLREMS